MRLPAPSYMVETVLGAAVVVLGVIAVWPEEPRRPRRVEAAAPAPLVRPTPPPRPSLDALRKNRDDSHVFFVGQWREKVAAEKYQLKYDPVRTADVRAVYLTAARAGTVGAFEQTPGKHAPWADLARAALDARARQLTEHLLIGTPSEATTRAARAALEKAVRAGCDDPLVVYWDIQTQKVNGRPTDFTEFRDAVDALCDSGYPAHRRVHAVYSWLYATQHLPPDDPLRADEAGRVERFWELFEAAARERELVVDEELIDLSARWQGHRMGQGRTREQVLSELDRHLRRAGARAYLRLTVRGAGLVNAAWDARGGGVASTVTDEGWRVFHAHLQEARDTLVEAAEADPDGFSAPTAMLTVCMGMGLDREEMEYTFRQAVAANPDNRQAYWGKLEILHPKWQGSEDGRDYLTFAWALALHPGGGPAQSAALSNLIGNTPVFGPRFEIARPAVTAYYANPAVFDLVREAAERTLAAHPDDSFTLNLYARIAAVAGIPEVAQPLFEKIGDGCSPLVFRDRAEYDQFRREAGLPH